MVRWLLLVLTLAATPVHAQKVGVFITYPVWQTFNADERILYLGGTLDGMLMFARETTSLHYYECLQREKLTIPGLSAEVEEISKTKPELKERTVQEALLTVLQKICDGAKP